MKASDPMKASDEDDRPTNDAKVLSKRKMYLHPLRKYKSSKAISIISVFFAYREELAAYFYEDLMKPVFSKDFKVVRRYLSFSPLDIFCHQVFLYILAISRQYRTRRRWRR
jgi:hypothetical protein